jgi:glutamate-1-semialdehyde 2,1-aminomutase
MQIDREKINEIAARENRRFIDERPRSMSLLRKAKAHLPGGVPMAWMVSLYAHAPFFADSAQGAYFTDIDGHRYLDMNLADTSMGCGYAPPAVAEAVTLQFNRGSQFLLPTQDTVLVAQALAKRFDLPAWQFTLSASSANTEAIRISRAFTARDRVLVFDGKYHGLLDETCHLPNPAAGDGDVTPELKGLAKNSGKATDIAPYNDLAAAERILRKRRTACVLVEAAATNVGGVLMPQPGFLDGLRELTRNCGSTLVIDETHTHMCAYGGLKREWGLDCDILVLGKSIAAVIPAGVYGLSESLAGFIEASLDRGKRGYLPELALGGTLFGNALQIAAMRATLYNFLTGPAKLKAARLGERLAAGIENGAGNCGLPWSAHRLFCRSGYHFGPELPVNNAEAEAAADPALRNLLRVYMANRGVWEAVYSASPAVSLAAEDSDIDFYLSVYNSCLDELTT